MNFDLVSDLHIDIQLWNWNKVHRMYDWTKLANSDILVIAGDISNSVKKTIQYFEKSNLKDAYKHILFVDGNHEHYDHTDVDEGIQKLEAFSNGQFHYLHNKPFFIDDTAFIGANGWYDFNYSKVDKFTAFQAWKSYSNDSRHIFSRVSLDTRARNDFENILKYVKIADSMPRIKNIVIITHTIPTEGGLTYVPDVVWQNLNGAYLNSMMPEILKASNKIKTWAFGHTHIPKDFEENGVRYIAKQHGYYAKNDVGEIWERPYLVENL